MVRLIVDVFSNWLWVAGGGESVTATVLQTLLKANHRVILHGTRPIDLGVYKRLFGKDITQVELKVHECPLKLLALTRGVGRYAGLACEFLVRNPMRGDVFVDLSPGACLGATYFRLPDIAYWNPPADFRIYMRQILDGPLRRAIFTPFSVALAKLMERMNQIPMHFVNSNYSESTTRKYYEGRLHAKMHLLYPPVNLQAWHAPKGAASRKGVISVARFSPWKRHDMQLQIVGNDIPLTMIGGARAPLEIETVRSLSKITSDNVRILVGSPIQNLKRLLWSSKVFLHTADNEPFGLSIVEAIAAGCVPVIRRSGGAAEIVPIPELTFTTANKARSIVKRALKGDFDHYLSQLNEHIRKFDESVFSDRFLTAVEQAGPPRYSAQDAFSC